MSEAPGDFLPAEFAAGTKQSAFMADGLYLPSLSHSPLQSSPEAAPAFTLASTSETLSVDGASTSVSPDKHISLSHGCVGQAAAAVGIDGGSKCVRPNNLPTELAQIAQLDSGEDDLDEGRIESTMALDQGSAAQPRAECPYERSHRQGSTKRYRMPIGGIACCNFCRRRISELVHEFFKLHGFHPMYEPDTFYNCKR